jgi:uncharacterized protein (TIGR02646 family)
MFQITKNEPQYFTNAKSNVKLKNVKDAWDDKNIKPIREKLRGDILLDEQNLLCAYCEREIYDNSNNSNIDHFKTRHQFPEYTLDYDNLLVSCNSTTSCSHIKDNYGLTRNDYENIINPVVDNPDKFFEYGLAGDILVKDSLNNCDKDKAEFTIKVFNLNSKSLTEDRKKVANALILYKQHNYTLDDIFSDINYYESFIKDIYNKIDVEINK